MNLSKYLVEDFIVKFLPKTQCFFQLIDRNGSSTILIEHLESLIQFALTKHVERIHGSNQEFRIFNGPVSIGINSLKNIVDLFIGKRLSKILLVALLEIFLGKLARTIEVHISKHAVDLLFLGL